MNLLVALDRITDFGHGPDAIDMLSYTLINKSVAAVTKSVKTKSVTTLIVNAIFLSVDEWI